MFYYILLLNSLDVCFFFMYQSYLLVKIIKLINQRMYGPILFCGTLYAGYVELDTTKMGIRVLTLELRLE